MMRRIGAGVVLALLLSAPVAAAAQDYPGDTTPPTVEGLTVDRGAAAVEPAAVQQSSGSTLPVTGGDIAELSIIGVGLIGAGTLLVRRTRRKPATATA